MEETFIIVLPPYYHDRAKTLGRRAAGQPATTYTPQGPSLTPEEQFPLQTVGAGRGQDRQFPRFINHFNSPEMLLIVDGSCLNNGNKEVAPEGGSSFVSKDPACASAKPVVTFPFPSTTGVTNDAGAIVAFPLEQEGPTGDVVDHTSNRAKLRAAIAALQFRPWAGEGCHRVVILTNLEYVALGATKWLPVWVKRRWKKRARGVRGAKGRGCEVSFWLIKSQDARESRFISDAKDAARRAAREKDGVQVEKFSEFCGIML
ncbi:ribonuclease H [Cladorrhinum sp. PSN332]|nr:ribonuclease H [Cladorrhinum sp. PSN332]